LREVERSRRLVEVVPARGLDATEVRTELDAAEVLFEDPALVERALDAEGKHDLAELSAERLRVGRDRAGKLLRERARTRHHASLGGELNGRARHRDRIGAWMLEETSVFGRKQSRN